MKYYFVIIWQGVILMKVAIYCRLSEEDRNKVNREDDSRSIQNQKTLLLDFAVNKGWEVYNIYSDDDYTGSDRNRPEFNKLIQDAEKRKFQIVLCKSQSRFTREMELVEKYIHGKFIEWGIRFISVADNADTAVRGNKKSRQINGLINEWFLEDMSENIKAVLDNKRANGQHIGSFALYGYKKDPEKKGHLLIDEPAAEVVRKVFSLFANGYGKMSIARMLNELHIPNPTRYKQLNGIEYKNNKGSTSSLWKYSSISHMLTNQMYIGNMVQGKYGTISYKIKKTRPRPKDQWFIVENTHEPIIDRETWNIVQSLIRQKTKPFITGKIGIFAKKAVCINCGYTMRSSISRGEKYLVCSNRHVSKDACIGSFIKVSKLEQIVISELNYIVKKLSDGKEIYNSVSLGSHNAKKSKLEHLHSRISDYNKKIEEISRCLKQSYVDKVKGIISESDFVDLSRNFNVERGQYSNLVYSLQQEAESLNSELSFRSNRYELIKNYSVVETLDRVMVEKLIDHICVGKRIKGTKDVPVKIYWNF